MEKRRRGNRMKKYYDPEYNRVVDESVPRKQYEWFKSQRWFHKSYEQFLAESFSEMPVLGDGE